MAWVIFILTVLHTGIISDAQSLSLVKDTVLPVKGSSFGMSCILSVSFISNGITLYKNGIEWSTCLGSSHNCLPKPGIILKANLTGAFMTISSLDIDSHEGIWTCTYAVGTSNIISNPVNLTVYIRVTDAVLQQNNQNITDILTVNLGEQATLTCMTGLSRPDPTIDWCIGSQKRGSGPSLNFTPSNADHEEIIYCQAYNTDPNRIIYSFKPRLSVNVHVSNVTLDPAGAIIILLDGIEKSLRCTTSPCRPQPVIRWWLDGNEVTNQAITRVTETNTLFIATSELHLTVEKTQQGKKVYCDAKVNGQVYAIESMKPEINVWYAPEVKVNISGSTLVGSTAVLMCVPQGNPPQYSFHPWIHMVGQTEIRRLDGVNTVSLSTLSWSNISIQDMGTYICTVDNSITGLDGQMNQISDTHVHVQGPPFIGEMQSTFTGETNKSASIEIPFHSNSSIRILKFIKQFDSFEISNTSDVSIYIQPSNITMMFYNNNVMIPGHVAVLHFRNLINTDFGNYTLQLTNDQGTVSVQFELIVSAPPSVPSRFFFSHIEDGLLVFGIEKGFNGGHEQTFIVEYRPFQMQEEVWFAILKISETDLDDPFTNGTYYLKIPKIQDGHYIFRVYAENRKGNSSALEGVHVEIKTAVPSPVVSDFPVGAVAGGVVGAVVVVIVIVVVVVVIQRWTLKTKMEKNMKRVVFDSKGPEYVNTAFSTTDYEALQSDQTGSSQYEALNDLKSTDVRISSDPKPSTGQMLYDKLQPFETNQGHMYSSLSSPGLDEGENKFYENTVKVS